MQVSNMLTADQIVRLQDIGMAACHSGAVYEARQIFSGLLKLDPDNATARLGEALSHIVVGDFEVAEEMLSKQILGKDPENAEASAMLGLCYTLGGKFAEAREVLNKIEDSESPAGQLARDLLAGLG